MANELDIPAANPAFVQRTMTLIRGKLTPIFFAGSSVMTTMVQLVSGIVVVRWVVPDELGLWQSVRLAQVYAFILLLGINNGLGRELPFILGRGEEEFAKRLAGTAFFCVTIANLLVLTAGVSCAIAFGYKGPHLVCAIAAITIQIMLEFYKQIFQLTYRSTDSFKKLTNIQVTEAIMALFTIPLVYFFGYYGLLGRTIFVAGVVCLLMFIHCPMRVKLRLDWSALKVLLKTGLPIFGLDYVKNSCATLDRLVLLKIGGVQAVGVYALAGIINQTLGVLPGALSSYTYPRMSFKFGQNGDGRELWRFAIKFVCLAVGITLFAAVCGWIVLPYIVPILAPKYIAGLRPAQIVLISGSVAGVAIIADALWSMKIWRLMVTYQITSAVLFACGPILGVIFIGRTVTGVACGVVIGSLLRSMLALGITYYGTHNVKQANPV